MLTVTNETQESCGVKFAFKVRPCRLAPPPRPRRLTPPPRPRRLAPPPRSRRLAPPPRPAASPLRLIHSRLARYARHAPPARDFICPPASVHIHAHVASSRPSPSACLSSVCHPRSALLPYLPVTSHPSPPCSPPRRLSPSLPPLPPSPAPMPPSLPHSLPPVRFCHRRCNTLTRASSCSPRTRRPSVSGCAPSACPASSSRTTFRSRSGPRRRRGSG